MMLFFCIGVLSFFIFKTYEEIRGKKYSYRDEDRMMYMTGCIITAMLFLLLLFVCIAAKLWTGVVACLFVIGFCILLAYLFYDRVHR